NLHHSRDGSRGVDVDRADARVCVRGADHLDIEQALGLDVTGEAIAPGDQEGVFQPLEGRTDRNQGRIIIIIVYVSSPSPRSLGMTLDWKMWRDSQANWGGSPLISGCRMMRPSGPSSLASATHSSGVMTRYGPRSLSASASVVEW